jgi:ribonuclease J
MINNVAIARSLGYLNIPEEMECTVGGIKSLPDKNVVLITTGSQGEPMSALARIALAEHKKITIEKGDTVILSSRFIPGNERAITSIINNLYRQGAHVIYETVSEVHVSGHAYQEELKLMINLTRPRYFIPIHGEYRHLVKHIELAHKVGVPEECTILAEDGDLVRLDEEGARIIDKVHTGRILVDGKGVGDVGQIVLRERRRLSEHGMVVVLLAVDETTWEILSGPDIISRGFVFEEDPSSLLEDAKCLILEIFDSLSEAKYEDESHVPNPAEIKAGIERELKRFFYRVLERRPLVIAEIITL